MRGRIEPALFAALSGIVYFLLAADSFYKVDGIDIVRLLHEGGDHPWHAGFLPALGAFRGLLELVGVTTDYLHLGAWFSATGAAIGIGCARAGMGRLGMAPAVARFATAAFALSPAVLTFATVVEFHGPMLGPLGIAFWWTTVQIKAPTRWGMALLGGLCHLPFLIHSQQALLPAWLLAFFVMKRGGSAQSLVLAAIAGGVHGVLILGLPQLLPGFYGFWSDLGSGLSAEGSIGRPQSLYYAPQIFWDEWLWPLLPLSLFAFTAAAKRALRPEFIAFLIGFAPFLYVSIRQLVFEPEFGAYMLPMVLPAAMLTAQRFSGQWWAWPLLLIGVYQWFSGPAEHLLVQKKGDDWFATRVAEATGDAEPYVLVGSHRELGSAYARLDPARFLWVRDNATLPRDKVTPRDLALVELFLKGLHADGKAVLMTDGALASLENPKAAMLSEKSTLIVRENEEMAGPLFAKHLRDKFDLVATGQEIWRLEPR